MEDHGYILEHAGGKGKGVKNSRKVAAGMSEDAQGLVVSMGGHDSKKDEGGQSFGDGTIFLEDHGYVEDDEARSGGFGGVFKDRRKVRGRIFVQALLNCPLGHEELVRSRIGAAQGVRTPALRSWLLSGPTVSC